MKTSMIITNILVGIVIVLLGRLFTIQGRVKRRLITLEDICGSNESKRAMILKNKK